MILLRNYSQPIAKVLISGGAGFIGSAVASRLLGCGHDVIAFDSLHDQVHLATGRPSRLPEEAVLLTGDVTHREDVEAVLKLHRPNVLVHLAAETGTGQSLTEATRHASVNVVGTSQLLDGFWRRGGLDHIVLASSRAVYGEGAWTCVAGDFYPQPRSLRHLELGKWDPEAPDGSPPSPLPSRANETEPRPASVYAATKLAQEHIAGAWASGHGVPLTVLRLQNVFGPGQSPANPYSGVVALFAATALRSGTIDVYEDGQILRDFVFVEDVVSALVSAIENPPENHRTLDIGSGTPTRLLDLARDIAHRCGAPNPIVSGKYRAGDVRAAHCDITAAAAELGYRPEWPLSRSLDPLLAWVAGELESTEAGPLQRR